MSKKAILITAASFLITGGLWFSTTSLYQISKGYIMYKVTDPDDFIKEKKAVRAEQKEPAHDLLYNERPGMGEEMGVLTIPKLKADLPIYHGTNEDELEKGVGHFADSVLPGEKDNSVLSGHRDTVFRRLGEVGKGDLLVVRTVAGTFTYKVGKVRIVDSEDRSVIVSTPRSTLTVSTCYPFQFIGAAPERYVLVAYLIKSEKRS